MVFRKILSLEKSLLLMKIVKNKNPRYCKRCRFSIIGIWIEVVNLKEINITKYELYIYFWKEKCQTSSLDFLSVNSLTDQPSKVGDDLAELKVTGPEFRYDFILIYCLLIFLKGGGTGMAVKEYNIYYTVLFIYINIVSQTTM